MSAPDQPDRDDVLRGVDLQELLEQLGEARGLAARGKQLPCPSLSHEQTGRTPPANVSITTAGYGVWKCHACDGGGTAVDALIAAGRVPDVAAAFAALRGDPEPRAARAHSNGHAAASAGSRTATAKRPRAAAAAAADAPTAAAARTARLELADYLAECHQRLYEPAGVEILSWLHARGLSDEEIRAHQLGADPGYRVLPRPHGQLLAPAGPAVTMPLVDERGDVVYAQARALAIEDAGAPKYLNPLASWIGPSPRVGVAVPAADADRSVLVVCEGMCDAIVAARHFDSRAVIGAGQPDAGVADRLIAAAGRRPIVVCFDADESGQGGAERLVALLGERATSGAVAIAPPAKDVNQLLLDAPEEFPATFRALIAAAARRAQPDRPPTLRSALSELDRAFLDERAGNANATGYATLDAVLAGGLRAGVYMLGAPPALGKTAIATQLAWHIARVGQPVLYLATEQTRDQLVGRHVCSQAELNVSHYWRRSAEFRSAWQLARGMQPLDTLAIASDEPHSEDDQRGSVARLAAMLRHARAAGGPVPVVVIDYLQDLQPSAEQRRRDEREQLSTISRSLLRLARRHDVALLIISSVARDKYDVERPTIAAFKGSGDIEYTLDAGLVLRLAASDPEEWERLRNGDEDELPLELHIVKNRFGRAGGSHPLELRLHAETGTILDADGEPFDNHPPALAGWGGARAKSAMPF